MKVLKYLVNGLENKLSIPYRSAFLDIQLQGTDMVAWFLVDEGTEAVELIIERYGTGWHMPEDTYTVRRHLATVQDNGGFVWHFFESWAPSISDSFNLEESE